MKKIISIIGARPQFIKHAPMQIELQAFYNTVTVHTGQHYDENMSEIFFEDLNIPQPDYLLNVGFAKSQGAQTGQMMIEIEKVCEKEKPDAMLIYGDTNSTLAGALVAAKMNIRQIHVESGLRSFNREMPEEINRIVADEFAYLLFTSSANGIKNLKNEGIVHDRIFLCGDVMCDMLDLIKPKIQRMVDHSYYFATIHRPYNTDDLVRLNKIMNGLNSLKEKVIFSVHPRTLSRLKSSGFQESDYDNINFIEPTGYVESISYQFHADCIITDSGGIQKEAYMLRKKCITIRSETEWTETLKNGWNQLVFDDIEKISEYISRLPGEYTEGLYGDGSAAKHIVSTINRYI